MQGCRCCRAARQNERPQRLQFIIQKIDFAFQSVHLPLRYAQSRFAYGVAPLWDREIGAQIEQVVLDARKHGLHHRGLSVQVDARHPYSRVGLIDITVGRDAQGVLRNALARAQRRRTGVTPRV